MNAYNSDITEKTIKFAQKKMSGIQPSHGWDHVLRVQKIAQKISESEKNADILVVNLSVILHDIARKEQDESNGEKCHAEIGSKLAHEFLLSNGIGGEKADHIASCILTHRFRKSRPPESLEAEILFDSDKIDSIGATGIGRAFLFSGEIGAKLHNFSTDICETSEYSIEDTAYREYMSKLRFVKDRLFTQKGMELAVARNEFMKIYFERLSDEIKGII